MFGDGAVGREPVADQDERGEVDLLGRPERDGAFGSDGTKLDVFLRRRAEAKSAPPIEGSHTLIEIESPEQLASGVRVHHPKFGVGTIRRIPGRVLHVAFGSGPQRLTPPIEELRIVADD